MKKIGLIGCGAVAGYGHLPAIQEVKDLNLYHTSVQSRSEFVYELIGTEGGIRYDREQRSFTLSNGSEAKTMAFHHEKDFVGLYAEWAKVLHGQPSELLTTAEQGMRVTEIAREATNQAIAHRLAK